MPRGRKPSGAHSGQTAVFSTRMTPKLREHLQRAAKENSQSLTQEVESRLWRSFEEDQDLFYRFGGRQNYSMLRLIGICLERIYNPNNPDATWRDDAYVFEQALETVNQVLSLFRPQGSGELDDQSEMMRAASKLQATERAALIVLALQQAGAATINEDGSRNVIEYIKDGLGELVERIDEAQVLLMNAEGFRQAAGQIEDEESER